MRSIGEMTPGDYVKVAPRRYEKIARVEKVGGTPEHPKNWVIKTESGREVGMWDALSYHKKDDPMP